MPVKFAPNVISAGLATTMFFVDLVTGKINSEVSGTKGTSSAGVVSSQPRAIIKLNRACSTGYTLVAVIDSGATANDNYIGMDDVSDNRFFQFRSGAAGGGSLQFIGFDTGATSYSCTAPAASASGIHVVVGTLSSSNLQAWAGNIGGKAGSDGSVAIASPRIPIANTNMWLGSRNGTAHFLAGKCAAYALIDGSINAIQAAYLIANPWQIFEPETIPFFYSTVTAQFLRPISDVSNSGWTPSSGSDLFAMIGETVRNDATFISATAPGAICEVLLGTSTGDPLSSINHLPRIVMSAGSGGIILRLKQGATIIKAWTYAALAGSDTLYEPTLTSGEIDSISDYTDLRLEMETTA